MKPHKHAEVIKAWADGAIIQHKDDCDKWEDWDYRNAPPWFEDQEYRIKPEEPPEPIKTKVYLYSNATTGQSWVTDNPFPPEGMGSAWRYMGAIEAIK